MVLTSSYTKFNAVLYLNNLQNNGIGRVKSIAEKRIRRSPEALYSVYCIPQYSSADDMLPQVYRSREESSMVSR